MRFGETIAQFDGFIRFHATTVVLGVLSLVIALPPAYFFACQGPESDPLHFFYRKEPGLPVYEFKTGTPGGFFQIVGNDIIDKNLHGDSSPDFRIEQQVSSGSVENAKAVATGAHMFSIVEENELNAINAYWNNVQRIGPLFVEKLQVLYQKELWSQILEDPKAAATCGPAPERPRLSSPMGCYSKLLFSRASLSAGPLNSGTWRLASRIRNRIGASQERFIDPGTFAGQSSGLIAGDIGIGFVFSSPLGLSKGALDPRSAIGLADVDPTTLGAALHEMHGAVYTGETFGELGEEGAKIQTIGTNAWLVATADIPPDHIVSFVRYLADFHDRVTGQDPFVNFQIFGERFVQLAQEQRRALVASIWSFVTTATLFALSLFLLMASMISRALRARYWRSCIQLKHDIDGWSPRQSDNWESRLGALEDRVHRLARTFEVECGRGRLSKSHYDYLSDLLGRTEQRLVRICRLHREKLSGSYVEEYALRWFRRGYISQEEYEEMVKKNS